jgi:hypothetical protein
MKEYVDIAAYGRECQAEDRGVSEEIHEIKRMLDLTIPGCQRTGARPYQSW